MKLSVRKIILVTLLLLSYTNAQENFEPSTTCKGCHPTIYNEFYDSSHRKASIYNNKIHKAAWDLETNCITCHIPKVKGTTTTIKITKEHRFHGFAGARFKQELLSKYVKIKFQPSKSFFNISIKNKASHEMFIHPLRVAALKVEIIRDNKIIKLDQVKFEKTIDKSKKPHTYKGNMIKANENRIIKYSFELKKEDKVSAILGYYLVNSKRLKELKLENSAEATKFHILKKKFFSK